MKRLFIFLSIIFLIGGATAVFAQQGRDLATQDRSGMGTPGVQGLSSSPGMTAMNQGMPISQLIGKDVMGSKGERLGTVQDFVVDPSGRVQFAIVAANRGKIVAVPVEALSYGAGGPNLALNMTGDQLASAPEFSGTVLSDRSYADQVYRYFGVQPRWSGQSGQAEPPSGTTGGQPSGPWQQYHNQSQQYQGSTSPGSQGSGLSGQERR
ncbi:MAG TPA: PRC-barrel domain-containing protein [Thermodesulfobacteriota bacterium]|nr:PRC-barrel domain-containing protein [Thermodesulfobacteriota bacterium]